MANQNGVWGIEIGQSALKALRCRREGDQVIADAFDYVEYPKLLSQPEAEPEALIAEALREFLSRNETRGWKVAISVPGQSGLAKFFKPPPVESKKIADIVKYEARQQIPFELSDVIWDYQLMPGSSIEDGYALETEVGLFAMKREQAFRQLKPFDEAGIEVDLVQLAPLAQYNMLAYDRMNEQVEGEVFDPDNPPPSTVLLALGTDSTDLIVSNGFRVWQRSMPLGGNHFTRQLTKDLKLTFAKAEHLKRNARQAEDPKLIFQAMRPVFNDLVTEVQRSVGFFQSINKSAKVESLLVSGNAVKLPGLSAYLGKNLGYDVHVLERFERLEGPEVLSAPTFKDNAFTFGVCYGLCLQGLGLGPVHTSLVPREILTERLIRAKKPWVLAGLAALLLGMVAHYVFLERVWANVHEQRWEPAVAVAQSTKSHSDAQKGTHADLMSKLVYLTKVGQEVSGNTERRLLWLELMKTVDTVIPRGTPEFPDGNYPSIREVPMEKRPDIHVESIETQFFDDLANWFTPTLKARWEDELRSWETVTKQEIPERYRLEEDTEGPTGPGWVIQLKGYHDFNARAGFEGENHVRATLMSNLMLKSVPLPVPNPRSGEVEWVEFTMEEMGVGYPVLLPGGVIKEERIPNPLFEPPAGPGGNAYGAAAGGMAYGGGAGYGGPAGGSGYGAPRAAGAEAPEEGSEEALKLSPTLEVKRFRFTLQFCWTEKTITERMEARREAAEAAEQADPTLEGQDVALLD